MTLCLFIRNYILEALPTHKQNQANEVSFERSLVYIVSMSTLQQDLLVVEQGISISRDVDSNFILS